MDVSKGAMVLHVAVALLLARSCMCARVSESLIAIGGVKDAAVTASRRDSAAGSAVAATGFQGDADSDRDDDIDDKSYLLMAARGNGRTTRRPASGVGSAEEEHNHHEEPDEFCLKNKYRKRTLKVVKEIPFVGLFPELHRTRRFEGSGVTYAMGAYWVVFDSLRSIGRMDLRFSFRGPDNRLVGAAGNESQYEGISYDPIRDTFFVLRESFAHEQHGLVPLTEEIKLTSDGASYSSLESCTVWFNVEDTNKGFESIVVFNRGGQLQMLGLCESNFCKTIVGPDPPGLERGNGRLVWAIYHPAADGEECRWVVEKVIKLPSEAYLLDYSAISFRGEFGTDVAVVSQEDGAVWIGEFDWEAMEFAQDAEGVSGKVYHFPRTDDCHKQYCNVEGVAWIDQERLVFTSDKAKRIQDYRCMEKDQTLHVMALP